VGQAETAREAAVEALDAVLFIVLLFFLELALAAQAQLPTLDANLDVFALDPGQLGLDQIGLRGFTDVHRRRPVGRRQQFLTGSAGALAHPRIMIVELFEFAKRIPTCKRHAGPPES